MLGLAPGTASGLPTIGRIALIVRRVAALPSSQNLTGPPLPAEPFVLTGRWWGTDEFLGSGGLLSQSPWSSGQGGRPLDKCWVQRHADALLRKLPAAVSEAVNRSPVLTIRKEDYSSPVRGAPVDRRGHIRVRRALATVSSATGNSSHEVASPAANIILQLSTHFQLWQSLLQIGDSCLRDMRVSEIKISQRWKRLKVF